MKIALVVPPISLQERYHEALVDVTGNFPPLGLLSLGTVLKEAGHEVRVLDGSVRSFEDILAETARFSPHLVGITAMTVMWPKVKLLSRKLKAILPGVKIIVGGVHATLIGDKAFTEIPEINAVCRGEGEISLPEYVNSLPEYVNSLHEPASARQISGISYRLASGEIIAGQDRPPIEDLDSLPIPDRSLVPVTSYIPAIEQYKILPVTNMFTMRGCPFKCIFCLPDILGKGLRQRSVGRVMEEIDLLVTRFDIREIAFWDDTFTIDRNRVLALCDRLLHYGKRIAWSAQARADCVTPEMLRAMAKAGCWKIFYGVESLVQKNLAMLRKGETVEQLFQAVEWTRQAGIEIEASFIFGIPGETFEEGLETIRRAKKLDPDYAKFFYFTPYGGLLGHITEYGTLLTDRPEDFTGNRATFVPFSMTEEELHELYRRAYREFYFRPKIAYRRLMKSRNLLELRKTLKGFRALLRFMADR